MEGFEKQSRAFEPGAWKEEPAEIQPDVAEDFLADRGETLYLVEEGTPNAKAEAEKEDLVINHSGNFYDENEDRYGETVDLATGKAIDNSGRGEDLLHLRPINPGNKDALPPLREEDDEAARWLRANGG